METKSFSTIVELPDKNVVDVVYYCKDDLLAASEKQKLTQLFIQLHDCVSIIKIEKSLSRKTGELERIVHNKVINERGHLC